MAAKNREKDQAMAARMKQDGVKRDVARCPICNKVVSLNQYPVHVAHHP
jgi:uncharacterized protein with PIN domain